MMNKHTTLNIAEATLAIGEFMNYELVRVSKKNPHFVRRVCDGNGFKSTEKFDPFYDWSHWRMVEEKLMEDEHLYEKLVLSFAHTYPSMFRDGEKEWTPNPYGYLKADLPNRCAALVSILSPKSE